MCRLTRLWSETSTGIEAGYIFIFQVATIFQSYTEHLGKEKKDLQRKALM